MRGVANGASVLGVSAAAEGVLLREEVAHRLLDKPTSESLGESSMETETNGGDVPIWGMDMLLEMGSGTDWAGA